MCRQNSIAHDGETFSFHSEGQQWISSWHSATLPPPYGQGHGSAAVCITPDNNVVLISTDGCYWDLPGGRPEVDEDWRMTMEREVFEEACVQVEEALLLGFSKGVCVKGLEKGLVLIRSLWRADVSLCDWQPRYETSYRLLVPRNTALEWLLVHSNIPDGLYPIYRRWFHEALNAP